MRLMKAEVTLVVYVVVGDGDNEERMGRQAILDEIQDNGLDDVPYMTSVEPTDYVPPEWREAIPRGQGQDRTVRAWLEGMPMKGGEV